MAGAAAAMAITLSISGCGSQEPTVSDPGEQAAQTASPAVEATTAAEATTTAAEATTTAQGASAFGQEATWPDGVKIRISEPKPFQPSSVAAVIDKSVKNFVAVEVTLTNGSSAPVEASRTVLRATSGDAESNAVFDGERSTFPTSRVLPGKSLKWEQAFEKPGSDFLLTVDWNFTNQPVTFQ